MYIVVCQPALVENPGVSRELDIWWYTVIALGSNCGSVALLEQIQAISHPKEELPMLVVT